MNSPVLVLNQSYEALNICRARRAIVLILRGKAEMLENGLGFIHSANDPTTNVTRAEWGSLHMRNMSCADEDCQDYEFSVIITRDGVERRIIVHIQSLLRTLQ